ncbi:hypothetical protein [Achromobacter sp. MFA1 R4]|uniref:hypothetical protein n=1 Tax=Achromobacter sp. MFA1 R4 TaxID=1881016 RepID=UPI000953963C|nr:hypothetical protein [Achromobacter sp. MFA1 R4]SIT12610.1 hypothetical protein SAMN05428937_1082 [Achromobacter sp. MFA1 R4]
MPQTLQYRPVLIDSLISNERINSYQSVFHPANDVELMGVYLWNAHVCGALFPLIGAVEITLRNAIDQALVADLGRFWWAGGKLHYRSFAPGVDAPHPVQAVRDNFAKATRNHTAEQRRRHEPTLTAWFTAGGAALRSYGNGTARRGLAACAAQCRQARIAQDRNKGRASRP